MATPSSSEPLPPFAIRELNGSEDDGVVQLTAPEYDSTLHSYPDAALTYLDEDDGETVTVGSSLELQQRLEEPIHIRRLHRPRLGSAPRSPGFNQKIHIFDIKHTANNLLVWRDHAAYSGKTFRDGPPVSPSLPTGVIQSRPSFITNLGVVPDVPALASATKLQPAKFGPVPVNHEASAQAEASGDVLKGIDDVLQTACKGLENHIGGFAAFLDLTANALRCAAEKTREADTTPVENFLGGMKTVLVEAGQMGIELLRELDLEPQAQVAPNAAVSKHEVATPNSTTTGTSFRFARQASQEKICPRKPTRHAPRWHSQCGKGDSTDTKPNYVTVSAQSAQSGLGSQQSTKLSPADVIMFPYASNTTKSNHSLMDMDASSADFATRFPPLTSLKRAKTIGTLRHEASGSTKQAEPHLSTKSALTRYPSIGQFEQVKRSDRAVHSMAGLSQRRQDDRSPSLRQHPQQGSDNYHSPSVEDASDSEGKTVANKAVEPTLIRPNEPSQSTPTGTWPEHGTGHMDASAAESSGTFFNRMAGIARSKPDATMPQSPALSCRTTSPLADPFHPSIGALRRANTVTASNPAARLNGPFDPMSGTQGSREEGFDASCVPQRSATQYGPGRSRSSLFPREEAPFPQQNLMWNGFMQPHLPTGTWPTTAVPNTHLAPMPGAYPYPPVPLPASSPGVDYLGQRLRGGPSFGAPVPRPTTDPGISECIKTLRAMGYGMIDSNEDARLPMVSHLLYFEHQSDIGLSDSRNPLPSLAYVNLAPRGQNVASWTQAN